MNLHLTSGGRFVDAAAAAEAEAYFNLLFLLVFAPWCRCERQWGERWHRQRERGWGAADADAVCAFDTQRPAAPSNVLTGRPAAANALTWQCQSGL